jgi:hypothetical protein
LRTIFASAPATTAARDSMIETARASSSVSQRTPSSPRKYPFVGERPCGPTQEATSCLPYPGVTQTTGPVTTPSPPMRTNRILREYLSSYYTSTLLQGCESIFPPNLKPIELVGGDFFDQ